MSEENGEKAQELFLGLDKDQLGSILAVASLAERFKDILAKDEMAAAFSSLREEYKLKSEEEQLRYIAQLKKLCITTSQISVFSTSLCAQVEDQLVQAIVAKANVESISK